MVKPAHIHITRAPHKRNANVLKMKLTSDSPAANTVSGRSNNTMNAVIFLNFKLRGRIDGGLNILTLHF